MSSLDILAFSLILAVAFFPAIKDAVSRLLRAPSSSSNAEQAWQQQWTHTLIDLLADLDGKDMAHGAMLCRELMWEIIGGDKEVKK